MYNFEKMEHEIIDLIEDDCILLCDRTEKNISIILTNFRLILLDYLSDDYREVMRISRGMNYLKSKEPFLSINLEDLVKVEHGDYDKYILKNGNYFFLKTKLLINKIYKI